MGPHPRAMTSNEGNPTLLARRIKDNLPTSQTGAYSLASAARARDEGAAKNQHTETRSLRALHADASVDCFLHALTAVGTANHT